MTMTDEVFAGRHLQRSPDVRIQIDAELPRGHTVTSLLETGYEAVSAPDVVAVCSKDGLLFALNITALIVMQELEQPKTVSELQSTLRRHFQGVNDDQIVVEVQDLLLELQDHSLISLCD